MTEEAVDVGREYAHTVKVWVNPESGETVEGPCPRCAATIEEAEAQTRALELDTRRLRSQITRMKNQFERDQVAKRDGADWAEILGYWTDTFPELRPTATGIKSERATAFFARCETGASVQACKDAVLGASKFRWISYGSRVDKPHSKAKPAVDLSEILSLKSDRNFDFLRQEGEKIRLSQDDPGY